ncbi:MAG: UDP-N-acetylglucosamine 2-epimerase [Nostoc sp.]|uniref:UDP-N-acetylglucosamine 2-epimerase n=1 Tax=Nostoc sp. TaxID=1180 RepID=UPI002FF70BAB
MRNIGVVTVGRSDYSSCLPILRQIHQNPDLKLHLIVTGMHLSPEFGLTVQDIEADGFEIGDRVEMLLNSDTPEGVAKSIGLGTIGLAQSFAHYRPDLLLIVGDRFELLSIVSSALPFRIPIAHISGGDITEGAIDNQIRYAVTQMSHLHFVAMEEHKARLLQMGEEAWRVFVTGDPALDSIQQMKLLLPEELSQSLGLELKPPLLLVTYHPTTLGAMSPLEEIQIVLKALEQVKGTLIFTCPNADPEGRVIIEKIQEFVAAKPQSKFFYNLGQLRYYSVLAQADLMVGNSSSGIWEAPSFHLPVVNIGDRQRGRLRTRNVIDVGLNVESIVKAIQKGLSISFRGSLDQLRNPYGNGYAAIQIVNVLKTVELDLNLLQKKFSVQQSLAQLSLTKN